MLRHDNSRGLYAIMWSFTAGRKDPALSPLWNSQSHLETIPQYGGCEAEIMVSEVSQYLSTKTSSSVWFFCNIELWKLCRPPENWVKIEKHCDYVSMKKVFWIQNLPTPPTSPFLRFAFDFCYCKFARLPYDGREFVLAMNVPLATWFWLRVFLNLSNLKLTRKYVK